MKTFLIIAGFLLIIGGIVFIVIGSNREKNSNSFEGNDSNGKNAFNSDVSSSNGFWSDSVSKVQNVHNFSPDVLAPGAIVSYKGVDHIVRGSIHITDGPYHWWEHMLGDDRSTAWLSVEIDEGNLNLVWWETQRGQMVNHNLGKVEHKGIVYIEDERGDAKYRSIGTTGLPSNGYTQYVDYTSRNDASLKLGCESFDGSSWEFSIGERISPSELTIYPAPDKINGNI